MYLKYGCLINMRFVSKHIFINKHKKKNHAKLAYPGAAFVNWQPLEC